MTQIVVRSKSSSNFDITYKPGFYQRNEKRIHQALMELFAERHVNLKTVEVCKLAQISSPTFYLHYRNCREALYSYEQKLESEFVAILPDSPKRFAAFVALLSFVERNQSYFAVSFQKRDLYLLTKILLRLKPILSSESVPDHFYMMYAANIGAYMMFWGQREKFAKVLIHDHAEKLTRIRVMRWF